MRLPRLMRLTGQARGTIWLIAASAMLTPVSETFSQDLKPSVLWANGSAGPWGTAGNWDVGVPGDGDVAAIANGGTAQVTAAVSDIDALSVRSGTVDVGQGGSLTVTGGSVTGGGGSISVAGNGALTTASLANGGNLSVSGKDAKLTVSGNFANVGSLTLNTSGSDPYSIINVGGNANLSGGSIDLATTPAGASFDFGNSWGFLKAGSLFGQPSEITVGGAAPSLSRGLALQVATGGDGASAVTVGNVPIAVVNRASGNTV